jgi:hypothetical protein
MTSMLSDMLYEETGQIIGTRILPSALGTPHIETSFRAEGTIDGTHHQDSGTYTAEVGVDGTILGEGHGVLITDAGDIATWTGKGTVRMLHGGRISIRGAVFYRTAAERLARLNGLCGVFEHEVDPAGSTETRIWAWC